jgi:hypothetical protein
MNYIQTNIRLPEDLYMQLKIEAAQRRKSVGEVVRERLTGKQDAGKKNKMSLLQELQKVSEKIGKKSKGISLSQELINMRYEQ